MKKFLAILLSVLTLLSSAACVGCKDKNDGPKNLSFYAPDGAPALAIAKFISDKENFGIDGEISYHVVSSNDIGGVMSQAQGDFIVMPVNAASKLYKANADSPYVMAAVITHGNLYIMSDGETTLDGLKGKVIGVIGQGLVPDLTFQAVLKNNGLLGDIVVSETAVEGKIAVRYFGAATEMIPLLKTGKLSVGLLPEPAATNLTKVASDKTWSRLDLQTLYDEQAKSYPQAVLMVRKSVYEPFKEQIDGMAEKFSANVTWIKENPASAVDAVNGVLKEGVTASLVAANINTSVVENCKIYYQSATDAKEQVKTYISKIIEINEKSAKAIEDDFFAE